MRMQNTGHFSKILQTIQSFGLAFSKYNRCFGQSLLCFYPVVSAKVTGVDETY